MTIAVLGTPCGGTGYVHALLRAHGLDVGHEHLLGDGIVCGFAAVAQRRPGGRPERVRPVYRPRDFDLTVRLIRDPLDVALTLPWYVGMSTHQLGDRVRAIKRSRPFQRALRGERATRGVPDGRGRIRPAEWYEAGPGPIRRNLAPRHRADELVLLALRFWVLAHEAIPSRAPVLRLASVDRDFAERVAPLLELEPQRLRVRPRSKGRRWKPRRTWEWWAEHDADFAARGRTLWELYGAPDLGPVAPRSRTRETREGSPT